MPFIVRLITIVSLVTLGISGTTQASDAPPGRALFESDCANCHTLRKGEPQKRGPHLENLFNRQYGAVEDFEYRMVWTTADPAWTAEELDAYLNIHGRYEKAGRADLIEYLKEATRPTP